jgi:hypothetical protein
MHLFDVFAYPKYASSPLATDVSILAVSLRVRRPTSVKLVRATFTTVPGSLLVLCIGHSHISGLKHGIVRHCAYYGFAYPKYALSPLTTDVARFPPAMKMVVI